MVAIGFLRVHVMQYMERTPIWRKLRFFRNGSRTNRTAFDPQLLSPEVQILNCGESVERDK